MAKHPWLTKGKFGVYYLRAKVPVDLVAAVGKKEIRKSLRTKERKAAKQRVNVEAVRLDTYFDQMRRVRAGQPPVDISKDQAEQLALAYFLKGRSGWQVSWDWQDADQLDSDAPSEIESLLEDELALREMRSEIQLRPLYYEQVDALLRENGFVANRRSDAYTYLCGLVHRGEIEKKRRRRLALSGENFEQGADPFFRERQAPSQEAHIPARKSPRHTFEQVVDQFKAHHTNKRAARKTQDDYASILNILATCSTATHL